MSCLEVTEYQVRFLMRVLQEQCFLWEKGASIGVDFDLLHANNTLKEKHNGSPLMTFLVIS